MKDLFAVVMLSGIYSLLSACFFVAMNAVDVAITEASVGACISTLLMLTAITMTGNCKKRDYHKPLTALLVVSVTGGLLIYGTLDMPYFGSAEAPAHVHVAPRYINDSFQETGVVNMVTAILASYRAFDTLGEVVVIFTAGIGVLALISASPTAREDATSGAANHSMHEQHLSLRITTKMLLPFIMLFAFYVQFHGDFGPGGGFQAGVIFSAAIVLYSMLFGLRTARRVINQTFTKLFAAFGILLYGSTGLISLQNGGRFLDYNFFLNDPIAGQHLGILLIELGVGCTVASTMIIIIFSFTGRLEDLQNRKNGQA